MQVLDRTPCVKTGRRISQICAFGERRMVDEYASPDETQTSATVARILAAGAA